jgi:NAD(P)-dependent dehydrogenase (short-subunit alcohol dehydrogenase family)
LNPINEKSAGFVADITSSADIDNLHHWLNKKDVVIDSLVNNVGLNLKVTSFLKASREDISNVMDINVIGPLNLTRLIVEDMLAHKIQGSVIFITSIHQWSIGKNVSYSSSKAALGLAIKELAVELAQHGIRVNGVAPGWVAQDAEGNVLPFPKGLLYKKSVHPQYIGRSVVYLASNYYSEFTTGATITIDGGLSLSNYLTNSE